MRPDEHAPEGAPVVVRVAAGHPWDELVAESSIANVYSGRYPTYYTAPGIPHDGFLADFLMRCKGFARD